MYLKDLETIVLENGEDAESAVNQLSMTNMAAMLGQDYLRECIHAQIGEDNIKVVSKKKDDGKLWVEYPSPESFKDIGIHFAGGGSLAVEISDCTEPECDGVCCTTYSDMDEFREYCGDMFSDYGSEDFAGMHLIPKF